MKTIVFTGGGTAGHVTPNLAIIATLQQTGWDIHYLGSARGIEKEIIVAQGIPYYTIASGKLRRYWDWRNLVDPLYVLKGIYDAYRYIKQLQPAIVFSKGGFVSVPVVLASRLCRIPVMIHESDMTPGLANRISIPFASRVCVTFPETLIHMKSQKAVHTGLPIRDQLFRGKAEQGWLHCGFTKRKPVIMVMGGSLGSQTINRVVRACIQELLPSFQIIHICGKGNVDPGWIGQAGYQQFEYVSEELPDLYAMASLIVSRAGSTSIFECLALQKPMLLIPLSLQASRGDQILNAQSFQKAGFADLLLEEQLTSQRLIQRIHQLYEKRERVIHKMQSAASVHATDQIIHWIEHHAQK